MNCSATRIAVAAAALGALMGALGPGCAGRTHVDREPVPQGGETPVNLPPNPAPAVQGTYLGVLRGGMMGIGGEHTGWTLQGPGDTRGQGMMVDVSRVAEQARGLEGQPVIIRGHVEDRHYVERGSVKVLVAASITPQQE